MIFLMHTNYQQFYFFNLHIIKDIINSKYINLYINIAKKGNIKTNNLKEKNIMKNIKFKIISFKISMIFSKLILKIFKFNFVLNKKI